MKKILYYLPSIIFNVIETVVIILIGVLLQLNILDMLVVILLFGIIRILTHSAIHYKSWKLCLLWNTLQMFSLFLVAKTNMLVTILSVTFASLILSGKGNIIDTFMWGGNVLNKQVFDWVKFNRENQKLIEYENNLKETDKRKYYIFVYRFKELKSYSEIAKIMEIDTQRVSDEIKIISHFIEYSIRLSSM